MVSLTDVQSSNSRIASTLPPGLVAVFVGATSGVGETSLKQFAKHSRQPRIYFVGRSQEAGDRIAAECRTLNSEGEYVFIKADTSLICTVDDVCRDIKSKEKAVNLLFLSTGSLISTETSEGLPFGSALITYSRNRFIVNLLPLLQQATALRRVVTAFAAGKVRHFSGLSLPVRGCFFELRDMLQGQIAPFGSSTPILLPRDVTLLDSPSTSRIADSQMC